MSSKVLRGERQEQRSWKFLGVSWSFLRFLESLEVLGVLLVKIWEVLDVRELSEERESCVVFD